jgi:hypothetical protein
MKDALCIIGATACWIIFAWQVAVDPERPSCVTGSAEATFTDCARIPGTPDSRRAAR